MKPLVISIVEYYNTIPLVYGLEHFMPAGSIIIEKDPPATCARKLMEGSVDISLTPVGALISTPGARIIGRHCIGAENDVATVVLLSQCPMGDIEEIYLDPDSRTSNLLVRILAGRKWGIAPRWLQPEQGYQDKISGKCAGVMIGNKVFDHKHKFAHCTDMAREWIDMTGLPFAFACWAALRPIPGDFLDIFSKAQDLGMENLDEAIASFGTHFAIDIHKYLSYNIKFTLDDRKLRAIQQFSAYCKGDGLIS